MEAVIINIQDALARIDRAQDDVRKFVAETHKPDAVVWPFVIGGIIAGAALFGGGMVFAKLVGV